MNNLSPNHERSLVAIVAEIKEETKHFVQTRVRIFKDEMQQKLPRIVSAVPFFGVGLLLLATGWLLLTAALVAFAATLFSQNSYAWVFSFLIVGLAWMLIGFPILYIAMRRANPARLVPEKTIGILKNDKLWLEKEAGGRA